MKKCSKCGEIKPLTEFYKAKSQKLREGYHRWCRECARKNARNWSFSERGIAIRKQKQRGRTLRLKYGVTEAWYEAQLKKQNGLCAICKDELRSNSGEPLTVDHCHTTSIIRGLLCRRCNFGLGAFADNPVWVNAAWRYISRFSHTLPATKLCEQIGVRRFADADKEDA